MTRGQEGDALSSAQEGGRWGMIGEGRGFDGAEKGDLTSRASVFSVKWDTRFSAKSQSEEGCGGLGEGQGRRQTY